MSYSFNTHTIQIPCVDLLNYLIYLCIENCVDYKTYYINKYNPEVFYDWEPSNVNLYNIELDFMVDKDGECFMEFVKCLYYKHCDNIMELESNLFNSDGRIINNYNNDDDMSCGFISYVV